MQLQKLQFIKTYKENNQMPKCHRTEMFGTPKGTWVWCLHCERCYQVGEYRVVKGLQMCPYPDCDGDAVMDPWKWKKIREGNPDYPEIPERDRIYPMYPEKK
jgi:hypothetical protein